MVDYTQTWEAYHGRSVSFKRDDPEGVWTLCQKKTGNGKYKLLKGVVDKKITPCYYPSSVEVAKCQVNNFITTRYFRTQAFIL